MLRCRSKTRGLKMLCCSLRHRSDRRHSTACQRSPAHCCSPTARCSSTRCCLLTCFRLHRWLLRHSLRCSSAHRPSTWQPRRRRSYCLPVLSRLRSLSLCQLHLASSGCTNSRRRPFLRHPCPHRIAHHCSLASGCSPTGRRSSTRCGSLTRCWLHRLLLCRWLRCSSTRHRSLTYLRSSARSHSLAG